VEGNRTLGASLEGSFETGTRACVEERIARSEALEQIVRALAVELERLTARFERTIEHLNEAPDESSVTYLHD
jgi:hypothetical protein